MAFVKATKARVAPKIAIAGVSGSGKTYSALRFARGLVGPNARVALIDTENGSASLYADKFEFDVCDVAPRTFDGGRKAFWHADFRDAINDAINGGYDALIIDSASHIWEGVLDYKGELDKGGGNSYTNWNKAGAQYKTIIDLVLQAPIPVVCCFRSKIAYVLEADENGKQIPRKRGLAPIARDGVEYEFTTVFDVDFAHNATASKDRTELFVDSERITEATGERFRNWLRDRAAPGPSYRSSSVSAPDGRDGNAQLRENEGAQDEEAAQDAAIDRLAALDEEEAETEEEVDEAATFDPARFGDEARAEVGRTSQATNESGEDEFERKLGPGAPGGADDRPSNGLEALDEIWPEDVRKRAVACGRDVEKVEATARRKFGAGLDDLAENDLRYIFENLRPKDALAKAIGR